MITIYSDGGADSRGHSAGACILASSEGDVLGAYAAYLGEATNNEAEIFSAIMGISLVLLQEPEKTVNSLRWVSDSEYSIKSATQYMHAWKKNGWKTAQKKPVKNQGLWKTFDAVVKGIKINPEHVYGHSGHPENEACDAAVGYLRESHGVFDQGRAVIETQIASDWMLLNGKPLLDQIRGVEDSGLSREEIVGFFSQFVYGKKIRPQADIVKEGSTSGENATKLKRLTSAYLQKIDQSGGLREAEAAAPEKIRDSISILRKWTA